MIKVPTVIWCDFSSEKFLNLAIVDCPSCYFITNQYNTMGVSGFRKCILPIFVHKVQNMNNKDCNTFSKHPLIILTLPLVKCNRRLCLPILRDGCDPMILLKSQTKSTRGGCGNKIANKNDNTLII